MSETFVLVAAVLAAFAFGLALAAAFWWFSVRRQHAAAASGAPVAEVGRKPLLVAVVATGLLASVGVLYVVGDGAKRPAGSLPVTAGSSNPAVGALAASLGMTGGSPPASGGNAGAAPNGGDLEAMTERLAKRLREKTPDDRDGWALLARSYVELGRDADAVAAYERTGDMLKNDAAVKSEHAAAKARTAGAATGTAPVKAVAVDTPLIAGKIEIDAAMRSQASNSGFVFVIARARDQAGAPVAARRLPLSAFPISFSLSDADSMLPAQKLSSMQSAEVLVRLSATGDAAPQKGDIESAVQTIKVGEKSALLKLSKQRS